VRCDFTPELVDTSRRFLNVFTYLLTYLLTGSFLLVGIAASSSLCCFDNE